MQYIDKLMCVLPIGEILFCFLHSNSCSSGVNINAPLLKCDLIVIDVSLVEHLNIGQIASNWRSAFHPAMIIIEPSVQSSMLVRC